MDAKHISLIIEFIDNNVFEDRKRKVSNSLIVKILLIFQILGHSSVATTQI